MILIFVLIFYIIFLGIWCRFNMSNSKPTSKVEPHKKGDGWSKIANVRMFFSNVRINIFYFILFILILFSGKTLSISSWSKLYLGSQ